MKHLLRIVVALAAFAVGLAAHQLLGPAAAPGVALEAARCPAVSAPGAKADTITGFTASPATIQPGQSSTLSWTTAEGGGREAE